MLLDPEEVTIKTQKGEEKTFIISKFPAVAGREIVAKYPLSNIPKLGDYAVSEEVMLKLMRYVAIKIGDKEQRLETVALVDNHTQDWETLARLEKAMLEYNVSFFAKGAASTFLEILSQKAAPWIIRMQTILSQQSSAKEKQRSTS